MTKRKKIILNLINLVNLENYYVIIEIITNPLNFIRNIININFKIWKIFLINGFIFNKDTLFLVVLKKFMAEVVKLEA